MRYLLLAAGSLLVGITPALAAPFELSGRADARGGYGTNPFLRPGLNGSGGAVLGVTIAPTVRRAFETGSTTLSGSYSREKYFGNLGDPDSLQVVLQQVQQFTPDLSINAQISYSSSTNAYLNAVGTSTTAADSGAATGAASAVQGAVDPLTIGTRTRRYQANGLLNWRMSDVDVVQFNGGYVRGLTSGNGLGSFSFYNAGVGYVRTIGQRMQLGTRVGYSRTTSGIYPTTTSYEPAVVLVYRFSEIWLFNGSVGVAIRKVDGQRGTSTGLGFDLSFCGTYPSTGVCVSASRSTSASGFGGARINTSLGVHLSQQLNANDTARVDVAYTNSNSVGGVFVDDQQVTQVSGTFDHKLARRWIVGADGRFQSRAQDRVSGARALSATLHLSYLLGRLQ